MTSYRELQKQAEELLAKAEEARKQEMAQAITQIKQLMSDNGITMDDLRAAGIEGRTPAKKKTASVAKYRGPEGQTWSGGRGRKPDWVQRILAQGKSLEEFRISAH